jgi:hypothetical protein
MRAAHLLGRDHVKDGSSGGDSSGAPLGGAAAGARVLGWAAAWCTGPALRLGGAAGGGCIISPARGGAQLGVGPKGAQVRGLDAIVLEG